jgi:hypothetical protein
VHDKVDQLVASPQFAAAWNQAVRMAHQQAVTVLSGDSQAIQVKGDTTRRQVVSGWWCRWRRGHERPEHPVVDPMNLEDLQRGLAAIGRPHPLAAQRAIRTISAAMMSLIGGPGGPTRTGPDEEPELDRNGPGEVYSALSRALIGRIEWLATRSQEERSWLE